MFVHYGLGTGKRECFFFSIGYATSSYYYRVRGMTRMAWIEQGRSLVLLLLLMMIIVGFAVGKGIKKRNKNVTIGSGLVLWCVYTFLGYFVYTVDELTNALNFFFLLWE